MSLNTLENHVLWLLPDDPASEYFSKIISHLSKKHQTVLFKPHITLARAPDITIKEINKELEKISKSVSQFEVNVKKVWCRDKYWEKISVEIAQSSAFNTLLSVVDDVFEGSFSKKEYPHLSLLYGDVPCIKLTTEVETLNHTILNRFKIAKIALVNLNGTPDEWNAVYSKSFST